MHQPLQASNIPGIQLVTFLDGARPDGMAPRQSRHTEPIISQPADFILHLHYQSLQLKRDGNEITTLPLCLLELQRCLCCLREKCRKCCHYLADITFNPLI